MRKVCFYLGTGFVSAYYKESMEFSDETTDEEIQEEYESWVNDRLDKQWWEE